MRLRFMLRSQRRSRNFSPSLRLTAGPSRALQLGRQLIAQEQELDPDNQYAAIFQPAECQLGETTKAILAEVDRTRPKRVVIDSLSELRLLAQNSLALP